jgi:CheY-like chemotaxis protein
VVDDQPLQRQLLAALLVPLGFEVLEAASGRECLEIVEQTAPRRRAARHQHGRPGWLADGRAAAQPGLSAQALPIVFVSANLFDHRPDRIEALRAARASSPSRCSSPNCSTPWSGRCSSNGCAPTRPWRRCIRRRQPAKSWRLPEPLREELRRLVSQGNGSACGAACAAARDELPARRRRWTCCRPAPTGSISPPWPDTCGRTSMPRRA